MNEHVITKTNKVDIVAIYINTCLYSEILKEKKNIAFLYSLDGFSFFD